MDESSRDLTTFYGTSGRLRYRRLNYGTISAQDIFDRALDDTIQGLDGVLHIRDDFVIHGKTKQDHDAALTAFLERMKECGLTLSKKKCKIGVKSIEFFGLVFTAKGTSPAPSKVEAIRHMSPPQDAGEVRSLIGMAQYSSQFIPNFAEITAPLRALTKSTAEWKWEVKHEKAFQALKNSLSSEAVLGYYEVGLPTRLMVDAGPNGLGLILFHRKRDGWQPVACSSRSLTDVEQRYSQMEREALAIRWACERCYVYLIGSPPFEVITDHQPLLPMFNNANGRPPLRIERWLMYLQQFEFKVIYSPGAKNGADYLSRHSMPLTSQDARQADSREEVVKRLVFEHVPRAVSLAEVQEATAKDRVLSKLVQLVRRGEKHKLKKDSDLQPYHKVFEELSVAEDVVLRGNRIVIPDCLQDRVVNICHEGHQGIVRSKELLRTKVWFPGMNKLVEQKIARCTMCQAAVITKQRDPLVMTALPSRPWEWIAADHIGPFPTGEYMFVTIDEYSKYPEVEIAQTTSATETLIHLEKMIAANGVPVKLKTDNGSPFQSGLFHRYCVEKGIKHQRITPQWPEGNGQAEGFMKNLGKVARTAQNSGKDWKREVYVFLGSYRATPHPSTGKSPRELMADNVPRDKLPQLSPPVPEVREEVDMRHQAAKEKQKAYADKGRNTKLHEISPGDSVLVRQPRENKFSLPYDPIPYRVEDVKGSMITAVKGRKTITRNSSFFKRVQCPPGDTEEDELEDTPVAEEEPPEQEVAEEPTGEPPTPPRTPIAHATPPPVAPVTAQYSRHGRQLKVPSWHKDYKMGK